MRTIAMLVLLGFCCASNETRAQPSADCKQCSDQRRACRSNYSTKTCQTEYEICTKYCRKK